MFRYCQIWVASAVVITFLLLRGDVVFVNRLEKQLTATNEQVKSESHLPTSTCPVIHMGIHKSGSTTPFNYKWGRENCPSWIDMRYEMPWAANKEDNAYGRDEKNGGHDNQVNFATCFISPSDPTSAKYPCKPNLLLHWLDIAKRNNSLFVSAETFSKIDEEGVNMLALYLSHWQEVKLLSSKEVTIIGFCLFTTNRLKKYRSIKTWNTSNWKENNFLSENALRYQNQCIGNTIQHLKNKFHKDDIMVLNYHDNDKSNGGSD